LIFTPSLRGGGAERALVEVLSRFDPSELERITLLIGLPGGELEHELPAHVSRTHLFRRRIVGRITFWLYRKNVLKWPLKLAWKVRTKAQYERVIFFQDSFLTDLLALLPGKTSRHLMVHSDIETNPNYTVNELSEKARVRLFKARYSHLNEIRFVSEAARRAFQRIFGVRVEDAILPILLSSRRIKALAEKSPWSAGRPDLATGSRQDGRCRFVCVGSLLPVKDQGLLLRAAARLKLAGARFSVEIVGDGPMREALEAEIAAKGLEDEVTLHGYLPNPYPILAEADVLVLPSISEAMPTVICESHILGVPVLASNCPGCKDILADGRYGLLFSRNERALSERMFQLAESEELRKQVRQKGQRWLSGYSESAILSQYREFFLGGSKQLAGSQNGYRSLPV